MKKKIGIIAVFAVVAFGISYAVRNLTESAATKGFSSGPHEKLAAYFETLATNNDFSGVVIVSVNDERVYEGVFGFSSLNNREPITLTTRFPIASLTKTFTAGSILVLAKDGKLSLGDPAATFLPSYPHLPKISVEQLLTHSAGLPNPDYNGAAYPPEPTLADVIANVTAKPLWFEPGTDSRYSSGGYNVLAAIIEEASGQPYEAFLDETFFQPLGMAATEDLRGMALRPGQAQPFVPGPPERRMWPITPDNFSLAAGAGSLLSTAGDLERWLEAVRAKTFFDIFDPAHAWVYGWGRIEAEGRRGIEQSGAMPGYRASMILFPEENVKIVILSNLGSGNWIRWQNDTARIVFGGDPEPPLSVVGNNVSEGETEVFIGTYQNPEWTFRVFEEGGHLWLLFNDYHEPKYLELAGKNVFRVYSTPETVSFEMAKDGGPAALKYHFAPDAEPLVAKRVR